MMVKDVSGEARRVDSLTIATSYRRILRLIDGVCDRLADIRREADLMASTSEASSGEVSDDRRGD